MRVSTTALFTLVALTASGWGEQAGANPANRLPLPDVQTNSAVAPQQTPEAIPVASATVAPEVQTTPTFSNQTQTVATNPVGQVRVEVEQPAPAGGGGVSVGVESAQSTPVPLTPIQADNPVPVMQPTNELATQPSQPAMSPVEVESTTAIEPRTVETVSQSTMSPVEVEPTATVERQTAASIETASEPDPEAAPVANESATLTAAAVQPEIPAQKSLNSEDETVESSASVREVFGSEPITVSQTNVDTPSRGEVETLQQQLRGVEEREVQFGDVHRGSPAVGIVIPSGYGADNNTVYFGATYQEHTRFNDKDDGAAVIGVGLGDAEEAVGFEISYTVASFGGSRDFGSGGFNFKVHRQIDDDFSVAAGWNGAIEVGGDIDEFEDTFYGAATKVFRLRDSIEDPFSRVAVTAGLGNGRFRTEEAVEDDDDTISPFGNVALRVAEPVSAIVEWTGQDLAIGASIAPFKDVPFYITPALRDIAGAGDEARFVLGAGTSFQF